MNAKAARDKITKVAGLLVNRFGPEADVFTLLNDALVDLRDEPPLPKKVEAVVEVPVVVEPETEAEAVEPEPEVEEEAPPEKPRGKRRY